ncbi:MAG: glycoside hydrolase family 36 protein [Candidatus Nanopelagicales bacterium]
METFREVARIPLDPATALLYAEGWQSWTPTAIARAADPPPSLDEHFSWQINYRSDKPRPPAGSHQAEGLLAVQPGAGEPVRVFACRRSADPVPSLLATPAGEELLILADGPVDEYRPPGADIPTALGAWARDWLGLTAPLRRPPTAWCSWYHYYTEVTAADVTENLSAIGELALPIEVLQIDDGYQAGIGDWLALSERFDSLERVAAQIQQGGLRAGIWVAPLLVGARSRLAAEHPDWLVPGADAGWNWDQQLHALDPGQPGAADYLREVFTTLAGMGFDYFKLDFLYAGLIPGPRYGHVSARASYESAMHLIRAAIGESYLLGCGAAIIPSIGLFDAMRVSSDTSGRWPVEQQRAMATGAARAWQHGRFWVNDPDCLIVGPDVINREQWAEHVSNCGGLRSSSDRLRTLDAWGAQKTRALLGNVPPPTPFC